MDCTFPVVVGDGDFLWSDSCSVESDDSYSMILASPPSWTGHVPTGPNSTSAPSVASSYPSGQQSPGGTDLGLPGPHSDRDATAGSLGDSPTPTGTRSPSSSNMACDITAGGVDEAPLALPCRRGADTCWKQELGDMSTSAKLEPVDDELCLQDVKEAPTSSLSGSGALLGSAEPASTQPKAKRPRGRPRKHPLTPLVTANKITKGRSKTGCLTCRKRKKKCDETKPRCMNCEKNAVLCEGYPERQVWKSGKQRLEEEQLKAQSLFSITVQPIFHGLETAEDRIFWKHYNQRLSNVLTVEGEHRNAFKDMVVPIAVKHEGVMHSILSLASKHIDYDTPYGMNILRSNPATNLGALRLRSEFHHDRAMEKLYADLNCEHDRSDPGYNGVLSARYAQMLCLLLESIAEGSTTGAHRVHLQAYQNLVQQSPPQDPAFMSFITEFFQYHIFADELVRFVGSGCQRQSSINWSPGAAIDSPRLLGVDDGLFKYLSHITAIRDTIRTNMENQVDPVVDYTSLYQAAEVDAAIRDWMPSWPPGDSRERAALLYKQMMWIYLFRSIYPPAPSSTPISSPSAPLPVSSGTSGAGRPTIVNTPPQSVTTSCSSSPRMATLSGSGSESSHSDSPSTPPPHKPPGACGADGQRRQTLQAEGEAGSPQPRRQPPNYDPRITIAIEESLAILESFKSSDPCQTLLLIPCLVIGTACFSPAQRERIRTAVRTVRGYTGLRNSHPVAELLEEVWRLMDAGEWVAAWDWQRVARAKSLDFLCT